MANVNYLITGSLVLFIGFGCGKKDSDNDSSSIAKPSGVLEAYTAVSSSTDKINLTEYESGTDLALVDEEWDETAWGVTTRFNCFGECSSGSITAKQYVDDAVNPEKSGPMGTAVDGIAMLCIVGVLYADNMEDGLPKVGSVDFDITSAMITTLEDECEANEDTIAALESGDISAKTTAEEGDYDRKIVLTISGDEGDSEFPFYYKNSDDIVAIGVFDKSGDETDGSITRSIYKIDLATNVFRMEYYSRDWPKTHATVDDTGFSFYRGYVDGESGEVRFLSNMGNSNYSLNNTFLSLNGNTEEDETQAGAFLARSAADSTNLVGAFVCFEKKDGTYVNKTGCTENDDEDRKNTWSKEEALWIKVEAKDFDDLTDEAGAIPDFTVETMFTEEPDYK